MTDSKWLTRHLCPSAAHNSCSWMLLNMEKCMWQVISGYLRIDFVTVLTASLQHPPPPRPVRDLKPSSSVRAEIRDNRRGGILTNHGQQMNAETLITNQRRWFKVERSLVIEGLPVLAESIKATSMKAQFSTRPFPHSPARCPIKSPGQWVTLKSGGKNWKRKFMD